MLPNQGDFFAVMYHYVRPKENTELRYLEIQAFRQQLDLFEERYGIVNKEAWEKFRVTGQHPKGVLLTFDDGLKDHFNYVLPILLERKLFGIFYVCTNPFNGLTLPVHLTHYLLAHKSAEEIWNALNSKGLPKDISIVLDSKSHLAYANHDHTILEKNLKRIVNWAVEDIGQRDLLLDIFTDLANMTQSRFLSEWYMGEHEIIKMNDLGYEIGSHTCSHKLLSNLSDHEIDYELKYSKNTLQEISQSDIRSFCFPFGGKRSYNDNILQKLSNFGYTESFSVSPLPINVLNNDVAKKMELPRYDCNDFVNYSNLHVF
jgi:peptidoglycan/xylan/chitin deacetylase (PgdA/CDA1 family)